MSDELLVPQVPEPKPEDPEDVSWALSTAEAMWARGDHAEGIKWVRRAAEAASEAEHDERALELAKAAAELAGLISRQGSAVSIDLEDLMPTPPPVPGGPSKIPAPTAGLPVKVPSRPPAPLPSKTSQPPASMRGGQIPRAAKAAGSVVPKPANAKPPAKRSRKSRENLDAEARAAAAIADTTPHPGVNTQLPSDTTETPAAQAPVPPRVFGAATTRSVDPTQVSHVDDIVRAGAGRGAADWDKSPTQVLSAEEVPVVQRPSLQGLTRSVATPQKMPVPRTASAPPPATISGAPPRIGVEKHDPAISTMQAVRVIVWRDASGVHVAPAGTLVSSITIDAVLVALEPNTDLTAWLGRRG